MQETTSLREARGIFPPLSPTPSPIAVGVLPLSPNGRELPPLRPLAPAYVSHRAAPGASTESTTTLSDYPAPRKFDEARAASADAAVSLLPVRRRQTPRPEKTCPAPLIFHYRESLKKTARAKTQTV